MAFEEVVIERNLNKWNVLIASILAGFSKWGVLSQGIVNKNMELVADKLSRYFKTKGNIPYVDTNRNFEQNLKSIIEFLDKELELAGQKALEFDEDILTFRVVSKTCNFCPIGVGEAELEGTACPYPSLIKEFANKFLPEDQKVKLVVQERNYLKKQRGNCFIKFTKE